MTGGNPDWPSENEEIMPEGSTHYNTLPSEANEEEAPLCSSIYGLCE